MGSLHHTPNTISSTVMEEGIQPPCSPVPDGSITLGEEIQTPLTISEDGEDPVSSLAALNGKLPSSISFGDKPSLLSAPNNTVGPDFLPLSL